MKFSIRNFAKNAAILCILACSSPLLANESNLNLEKINEIDLRFNRHHHHHHHHSNNPVNSTDVTLRTFNLEQLWKMNTVYLKDAIQILASNEGTVGSNEFAVVNQLINQNTVRIGNAIRYRGVNNSAAITTALQQMNLALYEYIEGIRVGSFDVPIIIELLQNANESLYDAIIEALALPVCERPSLRLVLEDRLLSLKELSLALLGSEIGEYDDVYVTFNEGIFESGKVGRFIGNYLAGRSENLEGNSDESGALFSNN